VTAAPIESGVDEARTPLLSVRDLTTTFAAGRRAVQAVRGISFDLYPGEILGVVGESGSGKSVSVNSLMNLLPPAPITRMTGSVLFEGRDLITLSERELRRVRGREISMIFQDPSVSLNPVQTVGSQIAEAIHVHDRKVSRKALRDRSIKLLSMVGVPSPAVRYAQFPHEYSGGMRQRAMIAMALANQPKVIIADEPTTALDVTIQAQVLDMLKTIREETGAATIFISHDLGAIAEVADRMIVMYAGEIVEWGDVDSVFAHPRHPYTLGLISSLPRVDTETDELVSIPGQPPNMAAPPSGCAFHPRCALSQDREPCRTQLPALTPVDDGRMAACHFTGELDVAPDRRLKVAGPAPAPLREAPAGELLAVKDLVVRFPIKSRVIKHTLGHVQAVDGVDLTVAPGESLGLVGESGCGKSTTGLAILRLIESSGGQVVLQGRDLTNLSKRQLQPVRREMQIVLQDPYTSLNPRMTVRGIVGEPLETHGVGSGASRRKRVDELLRLVGMGPEHADRFPHEFSGGQRQRIAIARALALDPKLLVLDEPMSSLDVSIQAQIVNLLQRLQRELSLAYLLISHDLSVVRHVCDRIAVMYLGRIVETGTTADVYARPTHPYTQALLSAVPQPDPSGRGNRQRIVLTGDVPGPDKPPAGCRFHTRCWRAQDRCKHDSPELIDRFGHGHPSACHFAAAPGEDVPEGVDDPADDAVSADHR
jgi:peptide/nickel transport system ATP-binding protein